MLCFLLIEGVYQVRVPYPKRRNRNPTLWLIYSTRILGSFVTEQNHRIRWLANASEIDCESTTQEKREKTLRGLVNGMSSRWIKDLGIPKLHVHSWILSPFFPSYFITLLDFAVQNFFTILSHHVLSFLAS